MISREARYLLLLSRSGAANEKAKTFVKELQELDAIVMTPACDISDKSSVQAVLEKLADTMPLIGGCIQASMVLQVGLCTDIAQCATRR